MTVDPQDCNLLAGDTAGFIAIFDIRNFCSAPCQVSVAAHTYVLNHSVLSLALWQDDIIPDPVARWRAHTSEVLSIEYVPHDLQPLVLSASADCTVKLWTMQGQYIGMFGQVALWAVQYNIATSLRHTVSMYRNSCGTLENLPHSSTSKITLTVTTAAKTLASISVLRCPCDEVHWPNPTNSDHG